MESIPVITTCLGIRKPEATPAEKIIIPGWCWKFKLFSMSGFEPVRITISGTNY